MSCAHDEVIDSKGLGTCKKCGQVRQYNMEYPLEKPVIIKAGVEGGGDHHKTEITAEEVLNGSAPFTVDELCAAKGAGVKLRIKTKKELKRRRHEPNGTLKKVECPYCPDKFDPRYLHLHIQLKHANRHQYKTPKNIVDKILRLFGTGTTQVKIIKAIKAEDNYTLSASGLVAILNRELPDRHKKHLARPVKIDRKVDPSALLLEVMKLVVEGAPPKQIQVKALKVKRQLTALAREITALSRLLDEAVNYVNVVLENEGEATK